MEEAAEIIKRGGVVAYPTESFYGLGVDATNEGAVSRLLELKERPRGRPILVLVSSLFMLKQYVTRVSPKAMALIEAFWPGGLTLIFHVSRGIPEGLTGGTGKLGVRLSSNRIATSLVEEVGRPVTSTSANLSGMPPLVTAVQVAEVLGDGVDLILDGGKTPGQMASTVLDTTSYPFTILREGLVGREALMKILGPDGLS